MPMRALEHKISLVNTDGTDSITSTTFVGEKILPIKVLCYDTSSFLDYYINRLNMVTIRQSTAVVLKR